jgi:hypothetical protein
MPHKPLRWIAPAVALAALAATPLAGAQVFKCVDANGQVVYQQEPCAGASRGGPVELLLDNGSARDGPDVEARWRGAAAQRQVIAGMPKRWVQQALGQPTETRRGAPADAANEVWIYESRNGTARVGFVGNAVVWFRSESITPAAPSAAPDAAAEQADAVRSRVVPDRNCDEVLAQLGAPGRREAIRVPPAAAGAERAAEGFRYVYEPLFGGLPVRLSFSCVDGRVATVSRDVPR